MLPTTLNKVSRSRLFGDVFFTHTHTRSQCAHMHAHTCTCTRTYAHTHTCQHLVYKEDSNPLPSRECQTRPFSGSFHAFVTLQVQL